MALVLGIQRRFRRAEGWTGPLIPVTLEGGFVGYAWPVPSSYNAALSFSSFATPLWQGNFCDCWITTTRGRMFL